MTSYSKLKVIVLLFTLQYCTNIDRENKDIRGISRKRTTNLISAVDENDYEKTVKYIGTSFLGFYANYFFTYPDNGDTLLHRTCTLGNKRIANRLIDNIHYNLESTNNYGRTPFLCAAQSDSIPLLEYLRRIGSQTDVEDLIGLNGLMIASGCPGDKLSIVRWMYYALGSDAADRLDQLGRNSFLLAAKIGNINVMKFLYEMDVQVDIRDWRGRNALDLFKQVSNNNDDIAWLANIIKASIERKKKIAFRNSFNKTMADMDELRSEYDLYLRKQNDIQYILENHNLNQKEREQKKLELRIVRDNIKKSIRKSYKISSIFIHVLSAFSNETLNIRNLIQNVDKRLLEAKCKGMTPILTAAKNGNTITFDFLVRCGANHNALDNNNNGLIYYASISQNEQIIRRVREMIEQ